MRLHIMILRQINMTSLTHLHLKSAGTIFVFACECIIGLFESDIMYVIMNECTMIVDDYAPIKARLLYVADSRSQLLKGRCQNRANVGTLCDVGSVSTVTFTNNMCYIVMNIQINTHYMEPRLLRVTVFTNIIKIIITFYC